MNPYSYNSTGPFDDEENWDEDDWDEEEEDWSDDYEEFEDF